MNIVSFIGLFYGVHFSLYYQHGQHEEGVTIIEFFSGMRQGGPHEVLLFALAHYLTFLKINAQTPNCVFPS